MDSLGTLPGKISGLPLTRPNTGKVKLTHSVSECVQSLHGSRPLGKTPKELCIKVMLSTELTFCPQCLPFPCWHRRHHLISPCLSKILKKLSDEIEQVTQSLEALQEQVDPLASVVLQNKHALDLLTTEKGEICLFLNKECLLLLY
jgi:hypothetical protein